MGDDNVFTLGGGKFDPAQLEHNRPEPNQKLIKLIKSILKQVEAGELREAVIVGSFSNGQVGGVGEGTNEEFEVGMFGELMNQAMIYRDLYINPFTGFIVEEDSEE